MTLSDNELPHFGGCTACSAPRSSLILRQDGLILELLLKN
ncbi:hypothetical protein FVEG_05411 [Fusarium verticillioides 7600]|uniref:Uncharacterized protein n=1 Tax=Gibberella moniliformis (strain M3125 / FGSC 7600) TaxID=334819 RepID=W7M9Q7_GIBM7|nr:hypothetical protein FVEG_05411 [Fusarium verticillioides 7600]EWG44315.1 hypothetical protein FVEG_05411 [Fusarium verticillioides 7600]